MNDWLEKMLSDEKKPLPVLSYPAVQKLGVSVKELAFSPDMQAEGIRFIAERYNMAAAVTYMDLSVEAEAFGADCVYSENEVPTITGRLIADENDAAALKIPEIGAGRTGKCIETVKKTIEFISDRPVFAGCIGPFSLAGRLMNVNEIMVSCCIEPELVHAVLEKTTQFVISYVTALKNAGANGAVIAEPLAGLLSPELMREFSSEYFARITSETEDDGFLIIYHNCGNAVNRLVPQILMTGCRAFHFGDAADMKNLLEQLPADKLVLGNISASSVFNNGTPEKMREAVRDLKEKCAGHRNFILSSGCDIPPQTPFDTIDAFFEAAL